MVSRKKQKSGQETVNSSTKVLDPETAEFLARLKEPAVPNSPTIKLLIEILEEGGSLKDFHLWNADYYLTSTEEFVLQNIQDLSVIKDESIAAKFEKPPMFPIPKVLL